MFSTLMSQTEPIVWHKLRHNFFKSNYGDYHSCGPGCTKTEHAAICEISKHVIFKHTTVQLKHEILGMQHNSIFSVLWAKCLGPRNTRQRLHKKVLLQMETIAFPQEIDACTLWNFVVPTLYHKLSASHFPFTWPVIQRMNPIQHLHTLANKIEHLCNYRTIHIHNITFDKLILCVARIIAEGVEKMKNVYIFPKNYFLMSLLPPASKKRNKMRTSLLKQLRVSSEWEIVRDTI